jgi:hypothetical protein
MKQDEARRSEETCPWLAHLTTERGEVMKCLKSLFVSCIVASPLQFLQVAIRPPVHISGPRELRISRDCFAFVQFTKDKTIHGPFTS